MRPQLVAATPGRMIDFLSEEPLKARGQAISTVGVVAHTANVRYDVAPKWAALAEGHVS